MSTKRQVIRAAAQELFLSSGLRQTSMDAIAVAANVTKQTLYRYYGSKDELFVDALGGLVAERVSASVASFQPAPPVGPGELEASLLAIATRIVDDVLEPSYLALLRVVVAEATEFPELARHFRHALIDRFKVDLGGLLTSEAVAALVAIPPGDTAVRFFIGPLLSYVLEALMLEPSEVRQRAQAELPVLIHMFVRAIAQAA